MEIRAKLNGQEPVETSEKMQGEKPTKETQEEIPENEQIDTTVLNNRMVSLRYDKGETAFQEALANITPQEILAIAKKIAKNPKNMLDYLRNFDNKPEIISQPEIIEAFKSRFFPPNRVHLYDINKILALPGTKEIFDDPAVRDGICNETARFVADKYQEWDYVKDSVERVVSGINMSNGELRVVAEQLKGKGGAFNKFVQYFGIKRIYPEV